MTIVIVGLGKLGSDVAARLTARGQDVLGLRRTAATPAAPEPSSIPEPSSVPERVAGRLTHVAVDLTIETPNLPADTSAIVVALAPRARSVEAYDALYRGGIGHLLDAVATLPTPPRIVFVSSTAVWSEDAGEELDDESPAAPATGTGRALLAAEDAIRAAVPEASCVRFGGLYGPARAMLVDQVRAGAVTRPSGWTNRIHRDDAAAVVLHLLDLPAEALPPIVAGIDEEPALLSDVVDHLADRLGVAPPQLDDAARTSDERHHGKRITARLLHDTGFTYRYPTYREGYAAQLITGHAALEYTAYGDGPAFTMLHPGGADSRALTPIAERFADRYRVLTPDRHGHGRTADADGPMTFDGMADDTIVFLERCGTGRSPLLGYSDGAVVALLVALRRPDLVSHLVFVSGVYSLDGWPATTLDAEVPDFMIDAYAEVSPDGREHFAVVAEKLRRMHELGPSVTVEELSTITLPVLVITGDDDDMPLEHIVSLYRALPAGELAVVPHASHGVLVEKPDLCAALITEFLRSDKPSTFAPVRRALAD